MLQTLVNVDYTKHHKVIVDYTVPLLPAVDKQI